MFQCNEIGSEGVKWIVESLQINNSLQYLDLWVRMLFYFFPLFEYLIYFAHFAHSLVFQSNEIGDEGAHWIAEALKINNSLEHLNLMVRLHFPFI